MWAYPDKAPTRSRAVSSLPPAAGFVLPLVGRLRQTHIDAAAWLLWLVVSIVPRIPMVTPIRYLLVAYCWYAVIKHLRQTSPTLVRAWPLMLIPALYILLLPFAFSVAENIRAGALFLSTAIIAVFAASRLTSRQLIFGVFAVELFVAVASVAQGNHQSHWYAGIFDQKNLLGTHMSLLFAASLAVLLDKGYRGWVRMAALASIPLTLYMIYISRSGTTTVVALATVVAFFGYSLIWAPAKKVRHLRTLMVLFVTAAGSAAALVLLNYPSIDPMTMVLEMLGKDATMTGRTVLWDTAERLMRENPWGFGAEGFWRENIGDAWSLSSRFHVSGRFVRFSFHNSYYEMGVTLGYLGMWALIFVATWAAFNIGVKWIRTPDVATTYFVVTAVSVLLRAAVETEIANPLTTFSILLYAGALKTYMSRPRSATMPTAPASEPSAPRPPT